MGCPIRSQLEVVPLGATPEGIETFMDKLAYEADGVMLVGRVKWHTDFAGKIESGLYKMMAIGLGKFAGAQRYHGYAFRLGLEFVIRSIGRQVLRSGKIIGGLAILEDAHHNTAQVTAVPVENMEQREEELLALVKSSAPGFHHCSWDVASINDISLGAMRMHDKGWTKGWGLGRHVLGSNYFHYVRDPWGSFAEYSCDIDYIPKEENWPAGDHKPEDSFYLWGPDVPREFTINYEGGET